jgi:hypothetical protein
MPQQEFDKSSKWMLQHQGRGILFLGGARDVQLSRALQAEVVQPRRLPDGLLEATFRGRAGRHLILVEVATYPERRVPSQVAGDMMLVLQARGVLPEVRTLVLCQRSRYAVPSEHAVRSTLGWAEASFKWNVVEPWHLSAEELLAAGDVGLVPWVPLTRFEGPPEAILHRCRERIDREAGQQRASLLAVSQVLTRLRFPQPELLAFFGGRQVMIESPLIQEILNEQQQANILRVLRARFGQAADAVLAAVQQRTNPEQLDQLLDFAVLCPSLEAFQERLRNEASGSASAPKRRQRPRKS